MDDSESSGRNHKSQGMRFRGADNQELLFLLVDDNDWFGMFISLLSEFFVAEFDTAMTVHDALDLIRNRHYDLITIDYNLPDGTARDLVNNIRQYSLVDEKSTALLGITTGGEYKENQFRLLGVPYISKINLYSDLNLDAYRLLKDMGRLENEH